MKHMIPTFPADRPAALRVLLRLRRLLGIALLLGLLFTVVHTLAEPQRYSATASLRILGDRTLRQMLSEHPIAADESEDPDPAQARVREFNDLMQNTLPGGFVDTALREANLRHPIPMSLTKTDPKSDRDRERLNPRVERILRAFEVCTPESGIVNITLVWEDKDECEQLLTSFQHSFIEHIGLSQQSRAVARSMFLAQQIEHVKRELRNTQKLQESADAQPEQQARLDALREHLKQLYLRKLRWEMHDGAVKVTASSQVMVQNPIYAEPVVTPMRMLSEAPVRLLRYTLLSLLLVLSGAALRQTVVNRRRQRQSATA